MSADQPVPAGTDRHLALIGDLRRDRAARRAELALPNALLPAISAHRRRRGPYTFAGTLMRAVVPDALARRPELVAAHEVEILTVAPELRDRVPVTLETLTSLAVPEERTRFYSRLRTWRIAHGLMEFLRDLLAADATGTRSIVIEDLDHADATDREFVAVLLRRMDPALLTVVVEGTPDVLTPTVIDERVEEGTPVGEDLPAVLRRWCRRIDAPAVAPDGAGEPNGASGSNGSSGPDAIDEVTARTLAARYVADDGTDDDPFVLAAYERVPVAERHALHDRRAAELVAAGEPTLALGAIPYHREHGSDPRRAGVVALAQAMDTCMLIGFYDATLDFCRRGRALTDWRRQPEMWWLFTGKMPTSLSALGRADEAEEICNEARARSRNPAVHIQCAYSTSMLYTRHRNPSRRDHERALGWINEAIALASLLTDPKQRAFNTVFHNNGLALIEGHMGRAETALELVTAGIAELDRDLGSDEHHLHRSVLRHNRATVLTGLGRLDEALEDYRAVVAVDPYYPEYHLDLGNLLRLMGREDEALAEYETALRLGPPIPEVYYNRGDIKNEAGDVEGALADFDYVLELDPDFLDAYINRAGLFLDLGDPDRAERDAAAGLALHPDNAHLLAVRGSVHAERDEDAAARAAFDRALVADPDLVAALCGRATVAYRNGDVDIAMADLEHAVDLVPDDPAVRYNRAFVLSHVGRWDDALADLDVAARLVPDDEDIRTAREQCLARVPSA
ncbi:tetratricopeptide repeat protein [Streptomyces sp. SID3343]|uniref:tetratricopeptide repeat protein n=1 Tax=Streptomyces sp. SID3343 TaxID=2690260 RepID=UPI00136D7A2B|nr:tetratricopeptide repeat protein [Streptomyces sp. SID3343]